MKKRLLAVFLCMVMVFSYMAIMSVSATGGELLYFDMEEGKGYRGHLNVYDSGFWNTPTHAFAIGESVNGLGVDGSDAAVFDTGDDTWAHGGEYAAALAPKRSDGAFTFKPGYTYYTSAMMKLNKDRVGKKTTSLTIWNLDQGPSNGFITKAEDYAAAKATYVEGSDTMDTHWYGENKHNLRYTIGEDDWTRVTEARYHDTTGAEQKGMTRWVLFMRDRAPDSTTWGHYQLLIDDYAILEVPDSAPKSISKPFVYGAALDKSGEQVVGAVLTASYKDAYDVNPMLGAPAVTYQWQSTDGSGWKDISGATKSTYTIADSDKGKKIRAVVKATSVPEMADGTKLEAKSDVSYSNSVTVGSNSGAVTPPATATGRVVKAWNMEATGGTVHYLGFVGAGSLNTSVAPISTSPSSFIVGNKGDNELGIDGSAAATLRGKSFNGAKSYALIIDTATDDNTRTFKADHTYFKSVMVRLNPDSSITDNSHKSMTISSFHEMGGTGFSSTAGKFKTTLDAYDGTSTIPTYDYNKNKPGTILDTITTDGWTHVTEAIYRGADAGGTERQGWIVWGSDWNTSYWLGNWEYIFDDYIILEVPNSDLLGEVYPMVYDANVEVGGRTAGSKLTASAKYYDVNPMATPELKYTWQKSTDGETWSKIGEGAEYTLTASDVDGKTATQIRCEVTVTSKNSAQQVKTATKYTKLFEADPKASVESVEISTKIAYKDAVLSATAKINNAEYATATNYKWQISADNKTFTDIEDATGDKYTVKAADEGKFIRAAVTLTTADGETAAVYSASAQIKAADLTAEGSFHVGPYHMEPMPNGDGTFGNVTNLSVVDSGWNSGYSDIVVDKTGNNKLGVDNSGAATIGVDSVTGNYVAILTDGTKREYKPGYSYFRSAMMKLNPDFVLKNEAAKKEKELLIWNNFEVGGNGFVTDAAGFAEKVATYGEGSEEFTGYNHMAHKPYSINTTIKEDEWTRVTESIYYDSTSEGGNGRTGWTVWGRDKSPNSQWMLNYQLLVDDFIVLEVPNSNLLAKVYPVVYGVKLEKDGETAGSKFKVSAEYYDVNPMAEPKIQYTWQMSTDAQVWTKVGEGTEYTLTADNVDPAKEQMVRCEIKVTSLNSKGEAVTATKYTDIFTKSTVAKLGPITLSTNKAYEGVEIAASTFVVGSGEVKSINYQWQRSEDGKTFSDISGATSEIYEVTYEDAGKFLRVGASLTTADGTSAFVYSAALEVEDIGEPYEFYVDGETNGLGTKESPFSTLEQARDAARALRTKDIINPVIVYIKGGEYFRDTQFTLTDADKNITFKPYPGEEVLITGGIRVGEDKIKKVTDEAILNRLVDPAARDRLYQVDVSEYYDTLSQPEDWSMDLVGWDETQYSKQLRLVVNGSGLDMARWPNVMEGELVTKGMTGGNSSPATFNVSGDGGRIAKWSDEGLENLMIEGHFSQHWTYARQNVTLDRKNKKVTTDVAPKGIWKNDEGYYFLNILDEIDMPGESYIDTENKIVYFYGYGDMENPEIIAPVTNIRFVSIVRSENVTFQGINFAHNRAKIFDAYKGKRITFDDCDMTHFMERNYWHVEDSTIKNCYMYGGTLAYFNQTDFDAAPGSGGSNVIAGPAGNNAYYNNRFNLSNGLKHYSTPAIALARGKGTIIENNDFYGSKHVALSIGVSQDVKVSKNNFKKNVQWTGDMGAIYYNTNAGLLGREISYNLFEDNASAYGDGWAQSIFWDDIATGPWVHHNVFNRGTLATSEGGSRYPLKGFGGQFALVENNVFLDNPYATQFQVYYPSSGKKQTGWWLSLYGKAGNHLSGGSYTGANWDGVKAMISDPANKEKYKGTQWEPFFEVFTMDFYNEHLKDLDRNNDADALMAIAEEYTPDRAFNMFRNNVVVGGKTQDFSLDPTYDNGAEENVYTAPMSRADDLFVDYEGGNFDLTSAGLAEVMTKATGFENFSINDIGAPKGVGGNNPVISDAVIARSGDMVSPSYTFTDADGDAEGRTLIDWYVADKKDGTYTKVTEGGKYDLDVSGLYGKYLYCEITPYDNKGVDGEIVKTAAVLITENTDDIKAELAEDMTFAQNKLAEAVVGTGKGEYKQIAVDTYVLAIANAKKVLDNESATIADVTKAIKDLEKATAVFDRAANREDISEDSGDSGSGGGSTGGGSAGGTTVTRPSGNRVPNQGGANIATGTSSATAKPETTTGFTDIIGHWAEDYINKMVSRGIVKGVSDTLFAPERNVTRAEFAALIARALGLADAAEDFDDVTDADWFKGAVGACAKAGIVTGFDGKFRPNDTITRQEMATMIVKAYEYNGGTASADDLTFTDKGEIAEWAAEYVAKAVNAGLITGLSDGSFAPLSNTTRAQAAVVIARLLGINS